MAQRKLPVEILRERLEGAIAARKALHVDPNWEGASIYNRCHVESYDAGFDAALAIVDRLIKRMQEEIDNATKGEG